MEITSKERERERDVQIGEVLQQSRTNAEAIKTNADEVKSLRTDLAAFGREVRDAIENLAARIAKSTTPDWQAMGIWAGIALTIVFGVMTPILYFQNERIKELDTKLQKEFSLALETQKAGLENLNVVNRERHQDAIKLVEANAVRIQNFREWTDSQIRDDLQELRQRRRENK